MNLRSFANEAGVSVVKCGPGWGGPYGYKTLDFPNGMVCGFKTVREARESWAMETFGDQAAKAVFKLLGHNA
jgi:hypothetical protein